MAVSACHFAARGGLWRPWVRRGGSALARVTSETRLEASLSGPSLFNVNTPGHAQHIPDAFAMPLGSRRKQIPEQRLARLLSAGRLPGTLRNCWNNART